MDLWQMPSNERDHVLLHSPRTEAERFDNASQCVRKLGIQIPALIDGLADRTEAAYTGWPERLYVVARGGRIVYKSAAGPYGFSPPEMERSLRQLLAASGSERHSESSALTLPPVQRTASR